MKAIPTLSTSGWVKDIEEGGNKLLAFFITSDGYQSTEYKGSVKSLSYLVGTYGEDAEGMELAVKKALDELYSTYFDNVDTTVSITTKDGESTIDVGIVFTDDNVRRDLHRTLQIGTNSVIKILGEDNG